MCCRCYPIIRGLVSGTRPQCLLLAWNFGVVPSYFYWVFVRVDGFPIPPAAAARRRVNGPSNIEWEIDSIGRFSGRPLAPDQNSFSFRISFFRCCVCVCPIPSQTTRWGRKKNALGSGEEVLFVFFSLLFIYPLIYDSSKWRLPAPPWRRCSCCHPSKRRFGFGFKKFQRVYVGSHLVVPSFTVIFVSVWVLAGFFWVFLDFTGFYWVCLGFIGFYWTWVRFTGFYWVYWTFIVFVRVFTVFFCILLEFTGFYWVGVGLCLGFIGFYWTWVAFMVFYPVLLGFGGF